jgi:hypothetical protein
MKVFVQTVYEIIFKRNCVIGVLKKFEISGYEILICNVHCRIYIWNLAYKLNNSESVW